MRETQKEIERGCNDRKGHAYLGIIHTWQNFCLLPISVCHGNMREDLNNQDKNKMRSKHRDEREKERLRSIEKEKKTRRSVRYKHTLKIDR